MFVYRTVCTVCNMLVKRGKLFTGQTYAVEELFLTFTSALVWTNIIDFELILGAAVIQN